MGVLIAYLLGILSAIKHKPHGKRDAFATGQEHNPSPSPVVIFNPPPTLTDEERAEKERQKRREKFRTGLEVAGFIVLFFYTTFNGFMYWEMRKATEAAKRALEVTERAYINAGIPTAYTYSLKDNAPQNQGRVMIPIENAGHIAARNLTCYADEERVLGSKVIHSASVILCEEGTWIPPGTGSYAFGVPLLDFQPNEMREIKSGREEIRLAGKIVYDDGFGTKDESYFCFVSDPTIPSEWKVCKIIFPPK